jgi:hypothetical protein
MSIPRDHAAGCALQCSRPITRGFRKGLACRPVACRPFACTLHAALSTKHPGFRKGFACRPLTRPSGGAVQMLATTSGELSATGNRLVLARAKRFAVVGGRRAHSFASLCRWARRSDVRLTGTAHASEIPRSAPSRPPPIPRTQPHPHMQSHARMNTRMKASHGGRHCGTLPAAALAVHSFDLHTTRVLRRSAGHRTTASDCLFGSKPHRLALGARQACPAAPLGCVWRACAGGRKAAR